MVTPASLKAETASVLVKKEKQEETTSKEAGEEERGQFFDHDPFMVNPWRVHGSIQSSTGSAGLTVFNRKFLVLMAL